MLAAHFTSQDDPQSLATATRSPSAFRRGRCQLEGIASLGVRWSRFPATFELLAHSCAMKRFLLDTSDLKDRQRGHVQCHVN